MDAMLAAGLVTRKHSFTLQATDSMPSITAPDVYCPLWRRLLALVYDLLIVVAIAAVVGLVSQLATGGAAASIDAHKQVITAWWFKPLQALAISAYFLASWLRGGQTLGMRSWRIRLTSEQGGCITPGQALVRLIVAGAPLALLDLAPWLGAKVALWCVAFAWLAWFGVAAVDSRRRALHDVIARTELRM